MKASENQIGGNHYKAMAIQPSEYIFRNGLNWCEGNAIKYITRHHLKGRRQDIEKAIHYLQLLLEWQYGQAPVAKDDDGGQLSLPVRSQLFNPGPFRVNAVKVAQWLLSHA